MQGQLVGIEHCATGQKFKVCKRICISSEVICVLSADSRSIHQLRGRLAWLEEGCSGTILMICQDLKKTRYASRSSVHQLQLQALRLGSWPSSSATKFGMVGCLMPQGKMKK
ncbi:hypothetical protein WJX82_007223 [Trebouxia sp. C0006]